MPSVSADVYGVPGELVDQIGHHACVDLIAFAEDIVAAASQGVCIRHALLRHPLAVPLAEGLRDRRVFALSRRLPT